MSSAVGRRGEAGLGSAHPGDCILCAFTSFGGTVTAADDWGGPAQRKRVRPALPGSVEELFHEVGEESFAVLFRTAEQAAIALSSARLHRAIGVIYRPQTERESHYIRTRVSEHYVAVIHCEDQR